VKATYHGSCHCGAVRFEAAVDLASETSKCNCSICTKGRFWKAMVPAADFRLLQGEDDLSDYQFGQKAIHHFFCKICGVKPFGRVEIPEMGGTVYAVSVPSLDDASTTEWAEAPITFQDGRHDDYEHTPTETRYL
jgi:hypothetical protein